MADGAAVSQWARPTEVLVFGWAGTEAHELALHHSTGAASREMYLTWFAATCRNPTLAPCHTLCRRNAWTRPTGFGDAEASQRRKWQDRS